MFGRRSDLSAGEHIDLADACAATAQKMLEKKEDIAGGAAFAALATAHATLAIAKQKGIR